MYEIAIVNPRSIKRRRKAGRKKGASVAKKRRKMSAKQRKYFGKRARRRKVVAAAPAPRRRRRKAAAGKRRPAMGYVVGSRRIRRRKLNPRRVARRRSNPRFNLGGLTNQFIPALYGAGGALALDVALGYIPLPDMLKTGYAKHATRIVGALGIGFLASKFLRGRAAAIGSGALTVAVYGLLKDVAAQVTQGKVKGLVGDYEVVDVAGYYDPASQVGAYLTSGQPGAAGYDSGIGAYMEGAEMGAMDY